MSFAFPWPVVATGAALLAGLFYMLQRLRSRRRVLHLPTAALWSRAVEEVPLRVLGARFRYWLAYLLMLAIGLALWLATAHPASPAAGQGRAMRFFYLDASAVLAGGDEAARAKRALLADVRATPVDRRTVILGDAIGSRLLSPGESISLLAARLDAVSAQARPSIFSEWLRAQAKGRMAGGSASVRYYGAWPVLRAASNGLPAPVQLTPGYLAASVPGNRGIVALGAAPAASGRSGKADVLIEAAAASGPPPGADALRVTRNGREIAATPMMLGGGRFLLRDIDADGALLDVTMADGDAYGADDHAAIRLPDRRPIPVALGSGVPVSVRDAVQADGGFAIVGAAQAKVMVRRNGDPAGGTLPALVLVPAAAGAATFAFAGPNEQAHGELARRVGDFGLAQVDAVALAARLGRPIGVAVSDSTIRRVAVWSAVFDPAVQFDRTATMPLFVSRSLRWLAGEAAWTAYAKAGSTLPNPWSGSGWSGSQGTAPFLADAGDSRIDGVAVAASLTDRRTTVMAGDVMARPPVVPVAGAALPDPVFMGLIVFAILLLAGEWWLLRRGWMS